MAKRRNVPTQYHPETDVDGKLLEPDANNDDQRWWKASKENIHDRVMTRVRFLRQRQRARREMYRFYAELYGTQELFGLGLTNYDPAHVGFIAPSLPYNVVRRGVNTLLAKITKHKPLPMVLSERGDYSQWRRARGLANFLAGAFSPSALDVFPVMRTIARDALVFGTGILRVHHNEGDQQPRLDRILPWEILVDVADARYGKPKQIFFIRWMDKTELKERYPQFRVQIDKCQSSSGLIDDMPDYTSQADMIMVTEAYRLPVADGKRRIDGRWAICIDSVCLEEGPYTKKHFGIAICKYADPVIGLWGDGLAAEMAGFQYEVNYVTETLRMAHRVAGTGIWMVPDGGDVPDAHFENGIGLLLKYKPPFKPEYQNPTPADPQTYQYQQQCATGALEWSGISTMSANATKPAGITAARALQTLDDMEADNQAVFEDNYEALALSIADLLIEEYKELAAENDNGDGLAMMVPERRSLLKVNWKDVDMKRDAIVMQVWPTNLLGRTPAARLQMVNDLFNGGIIDRALYLKLLDAPDIDAETDLASALQEVADAQIEAILDINPSWAPRSMDRAYAKSRPDTYQDLVYAMHRAQQHICFGKLRGVPDNLIDLLRRYITDAKSELDKATPPVPATPQAPQLAPAPIAPPGMAPAAPAPLQAPGSAA
jgi:hypothetical protein